MSRRKRKQRVASDVDLVSICMRCEGAKGPINEEAPWTYCAICGGKLEDDWERLMMTRKKARAMARAYEAREAAND